MATTFSTPGWACTRVVMSSSARVVRSSEAPFGKLCNDEEVALVLDRQEAGRHAAQRVDGKHDEAGDDHRHQPGCAPTMRRMRPA